MEHRIRVCVGMCADVVSPNKAAELIYLREPGEEISIEDEYTIDFNDDGSVFIYAEDNLIGHYLSDME